SRLWYSSASHSALFRRAATLSAYAAPSVRLEPTNHTLRVFPAKAIAHRIVTQKPRTVTIRSTGAETARRGPLPCGSGPAGGPSGPPSDRVRQAGTGWRRGRAGRPAGLAARPGTSPRGPYRVGRTCV